MVNVLLILRDYSPGDLDALTVLEKRAFPVGPYNRRMLKRVFSTKGSFSIIAEDNGTVAAYIVVLPLDEQSADIESIAVDPSYQNSGIGKLLMVKMESIMIENGYRYSILEVRDRNTNAIGFYKKLGYEIIKHYPTYYHEFYEGSRGAFRMRKLL